MSITTEESNLLEQRETMLTPGEREAIREAFYTLRGTARRAGLVVAGDDRAARLEAAMVRYMLDSRPQRIG